MTIDEELTMLDDSIRRLKIEYDVYFGGGAKKPPADAEWRVQSLIKKYSDGARMNFAQRFRYNTIQQKYALYSSLWQQKLKIKEEGYRRPQDAMLGIAGLRTEQEHLAQAELEHKRGEQPQQEGFRAHISDPDTDHAHVEKLFNAMMEAKKKSEPGSAPANFDSFKMFVKKKTEQLRKEYGCHAVEYSVEMENGQVRLKAKAKV